MVHTLEAIRGGGGSVKIGTTGTIGALMSRELDSAKHATKVSESCASVSVPTGDSTPREPKSKTSKDEASSNGPNIAKNRKCPENVRRSKLSSGGTHHIPMLTSCDISIDGTPIRKKSVKKGPSIVEIVDVKCGNPDRTWVNPITNRLKKLSFSKLSDNMV
ncbi:uncharacterized protein LOC142549029 [Primulina tabacum]|uniref:uncharacterized protein LOC142549029 n=1 Tax=Primulina tabacum TaxID=48773 RepID=UPI003F5AB91D